MQLLTRNIVLLPSGVVAAEALKMSQILAQDYQTGIVLNEVSALPHLTIHQFAFPEQNLKRVEEIVRQIAQITKPFEIRLDRIGRFGDGGIWWDAVIADDELWQLHARAVKALSPLQERARLPHLAGILTGDIPVSSAEREAYQAYGNPWANPERPTPPYRPHITLSKLNNASDMEAALATVHPPEQTFVATSLHLTLLGPNGTCPGSLREYSFAA